MEATASASSAAGVARKPSSHSSLSVVDAYSRTPLGILLNFCGNSFMLVGKFPIEPKRLLTLAVQLPSDVAGRLPLTFQAVCLWCQKSSYSDEFGAGFEIRHINPENLKRLQQLLGQGAQHRQVGQSSATGGFSRPR
mgnify:FL=1